MNTNTAGWKFYQKHLQFFYNKDIEGLLASDYTEDAQLISVDFAVRGYDAMRQIFHAYLDMMGDFTVKSTDQFIETDDTILLEATIDSPNVGIRKVYDVFIMRNGKISHHITGVR
jgi:hypothetical protein